MYDVLLSCPGDAYDECYLAVKNAIDKFNKDAQTNYGVGISLKHWILDSYPQSGDKAQSLLNSQIVDPSDAAIAIFWTRFGTPTDTYSSGTEEEIDRLIKSKKQVFLYFFNKPIPPSITESPDYFESRKKIVFLKEKYEGMYCVINDELELEEKLTNHLKMYYCKNYSSKPINSERWFRSDNGEEISADNLIKYGNITAQIDRNIARVEVKKPDGETFYAEYDTDKNEVKNITANGFPQEYSIEIPQNIIVSKQSNMVSVKGVIYRAENYILKFNGQFNVLYDTDRNKIQHISAKAPAGMKIFIDSTNKKVCIVNN
jgi:hypothetical protein